MQSRCHRALPSSRAWYHVLTPILSNSVANPVSQMNRPLYCHYRHPMIRRIDCGLIRYPLIRLHFITDRSRRFPSLLEFNKWGKLGKAMYHHNSCFTYWDPLTHSKRLGPPTIHAHVSNLNETQWVSHTRREGLWGEFA